jgi:hypothetical protein
LHLHEQLLHIESWLNYLILFLLLRKLKTYRKDLNGSKC